MKDKEFEAQLSAYRGYLIALNTIKAIKMRFHATHESSRPRATINNREQALALRESFMKQIEDYLDNGVEDYQQEHYELCLGCLANSTWTAKTGRCFYMDVSKKGQRRINSDMLLATPCANFTARLCN